MSGIGPDYGRLCLVSFAVPPQKAFVLPHSLEQEKLRLTTVAVQGVVFDRYRLHDTSRAPIWCSPELATELATDLKFHLKPLVTGLPDYD